MDHGNDGFDVPAPPTLTCDDEQARRVCAMLIDLANSHGPRSTAQLARRYHPDTARSSWDKLVARDLENLALCGLVVRKSGRDEEGGALWSVDEDASFADVHGLSPEDAEALSCALSPLVTDPSFAWRDELRIALAKVDRSFDEDDANDTTETDEERQDRPSSVMASALADHTPVDITYRTATGDVVSRTVAPYGFFGLRGHLYYVAPRLEDGQAVPDSLRDYRADRLVRAKPTKGGRFEVPADFDVADHVLLPFQIGPDTGSKLEFLVPAARRRDLEASARGIGHLRPSDADKDDLVWKVDGRDLRAAASWAILMGITPTSPASLVRAWRDLLQGSAALEAAQGLPAAIASKTPHGRGPHGSRAGRPGSKETARLLAALVGSLDVAGDEISVPAVASRLDVSAKTAEKLLYLVETSTDDESALPIYADDEGFSLGLLTDTGTRGKPLRLSRHEARALVSALDYLGVPEDDHAREAAERALMPTDADMDEDDVEALVSPSGTPRVAANVAACAHAIVDERLVSFTYQGSNDATSRERHVAPRALHQADGAWYLDAYDLDARGSRTFRADRISSLVDAGARVTRDEASDQEREPRTMRLRFSDPTYLTLLMWPGLVQDEGVQADGSIDASIPWYGTDWLVRAVCACGGTVTSDDAELVGRVAALAEGTLAR